MPFITEENRIVYQQDGQTLAEITFPTFEEGVVNIDHTFVDPVLRGQGVAGQLMQHTADALRATGRKAVATCSYAQKWFSQHPDQQDLLR